MACGQCSKPKKPIVKAAPKVQPTVTVKVVKK